MDRFFIDEQMKGEFELTDSDDVRHIGKVLRLKAGECIEVVDKEQNEYLCEIVAVRKDCICLRKKERIEKKRELDVKIRVYQGIPKAQKMDFIVQKLTEIGVCDVYPVRFERCVSLMKEEKEEKKIRRYEKIAYEAAKQSKRTVIPTIHPALDLSALCEELKKNQANLLFYEEETDHTLKDFFQAWAEKNLDGIGIIIGPEGGLTEGEVQKLSKEGCEVLTLGNRILRTETAGLAAAAIVAYELENRMDKGGVYGKE